MKALITGGCGQIGSHIADILLSRGDHVVSIDNFATGRSEHLPPRPNLTLIEGSIADKPLVYSVFEDTCPDIVIHTAASYKDPDDWYQDTLTNAVGGSNVIKAAKAVDAKRFIYFQTALCYGTTPLEQPITLNHPKRPGSSSYSISKTAAEDYLELSGLDYVTFRLANVVGPRNVSGPLPIFFKRLSQGQSCFVTTARRDFVFVSDLAATAVAAVDGTGHGAYHFSSGTDIAIKELYDEVVKAMGINDYPEPEIKPLAKDDVASILLDPAKTFEDFGALSFTPASEFVPKAIAYYKEYGVAGEYTHLRVEEPAKS